MAVEMEIYGLARVPASAELPSLVLKVKGQERFLVIGVGPLELSAIASAAANEPPPRPMTHDLLVSALVACGARVTEALIHSIVDHVFHARLVLDVQGRHAELDARSSDAIAVAVRVGIPIHVEDAVLEQAGLAPAAPPTGEQSPEPGERIGEEQLGAFRDVIKGLDLDDLGRRDPAA